MAILLSHAERSRRIENLVDQMSGVSELSRAAEDLVAQMIAAGNAASEIDTAVANLLTPLGTLRTNVASLLGALSITNQHVVKVGMPHNYNYARIVAEDVINYGNGTIRAQADFESILNPFSVFAAGDVITISDAENPLNNGSYIVRAGPNTAGTTNHISNGEFTGAATDWTLSGAGVAYGTNNIAFTSSSNGTAKQAVADMDTAWTAGKAYLVTFTVGFTSGAIAVGTNTTPAQFSANTAGVHQCVIVADAHADGLVFTGVLATLTIDLVSMVPFSGIALTSPLGADDTKDESIVITLSER